MDIAPGDTHSIEGEQLTAWAVLAGGAHVRMDFIGTDGTSHRIVLPFDVLTARIDLQRGITGGSR